MAAVPGSPSGLVNGNVSPWTAFARIASTRFGQQWKAVGVASGLGLGLTLTSSKASGLWERERRTGPEIGARDALQETASGLAWENSLLASLSLSGSGSAQAEEWVEPKTGVAFPGSSPEGKQLTGIGLRKKNILGLKSITVYAYGVYADPESLKSTLGEKFGSLKPEEARNSQELFKDLTVKDVGLTVRLVIVYGKLKIGAIRNAFEGSLGKGIKKFSGKEDKELLGSFTNIFKDEMKLPRGTTIDITRLPGQVLQTKIDGEVIGAVESPLLCQALFDLYIGEEAFDKSAKETMGSGFAQLLSADTRNSNLEG